LLVAFEQIDEGKFKNYKSNVVVFAGRIEIPFADSYFDFMILNHVSDHISNEVGDDSQIWASARVGC